MNDLLSTVQLQEVLDTLPFSTMVVDLDGCIEYVNNIARTFFYPPDAPYYRKRGGEAINCIHAHENTKGCGHADKCRECVVRNSVNLAFSSGLVTRKRTYLELHRNDAMVEVPVLVTTKCIMIEKRNLCILLIEDISELIQLNSLLPICSSCKKIRNDSDYWQSVDSYVTEHIADVRFSHSLCPECLIKFYPQFANKILENHNPVAIFQYCLLYTSEAETVRE